jgi:hypothetical protein
LVVSFLWILLYWVNDCEQTFVCGKGANGQSLYGTQDAQDDNRTVNRECESASWMSSNQELVDCSLICYMFHLIVWEEIDTCDKLIIGFII